MTEQGTQSHWCRTNEKLRPRQILSVSFALSTWACTRLANAEPTTLPETLPPGAGHKHETPHWPGWPQDGTPPSPYLR